LEKLYFLKALINFHLVKQFILAGNWNGRALTKEPEIESLSFLFKKKVDYHKNGNV